MSHLDRHVQGRPEKTVRPQWANGLDAGLVTLLASLGPWGVNEVHWLSGADSTLVIWLRTQTKAERARLEAQGWLIFHLHLMLTHAGVPYQLLRSVRAEITSLEDEEFLFRF